MSFANGFIQNSPITLDNDVSTWEQFSVSGAIPANTRWLVTQVAYLNSSIGTNAGYVDSVSLGITGNFTNRTAWQAAISGSSVLCEDFEAEPNATGWSTFNMPYSTAGGITIDRLAGGTAQQFIKIGYNGTQTPHIRDFTAGITWNPGNAFTAFGFDYSTAHEQWQIEIDVNGSPTTIGTLSPWTEGFLGLVLPAPSLATITLRGGLSGGAQGGISLDNMCFALDSPPPCAPCPPVGVSNTSIYLITGNASGTDWSWKFEQTNGVGKFCAEDLCVVGVAAVDDVDGDGFTGTAADVATRFANSINDYSTANGCFFGLSALVQPILPPIPPLIPIGAKLFVFYDTAPATTLFVGACADPTCSVLFNIPSSGCLFNPLIQKIVPSGQDCNGNGEDDVIDILFGTSQDTNQNSVPDECEPSKALLEPGTASCPSAAPSECGGCGQASLGRSDSVNRFSGEYIHTVGDLRIAGRGMDFVWQRKYRSRVGPSTTAGNGWDQAYNMRLIQAGADLELCDGQGRRDRYVVQGNGIWGADQFFRVINQNLVPFPVNQFRVSAIHHATLL